MNSSGPSIPKILLRSLLLSYILSGILIAGLTFALYKMKLPEAQTNAAVLIIYCIVCLIGGFTAGKGAQSRRFFWGLAIGVLYFAVLFLVSFIISRGTTPELLRSMTVLGCCAAGGMIGGMLS